MNILIAARLNSEYKLKTTLKPIVDIEFVEHIYLVRRYHLDLPKTTCYSPPGFLQKTILTTEIYRLSAIFYICVFKKVDCLMGIHFILHCVYTAMAKMIFRKPLIMLIIENPKKYRGHGLFKFFLRRADLIGVRGSTSKKYIATSAKIDAKKIFITPDVHDFNTKISDPAKQKIYDLIFVGYYTVAKRLDILLDVIKGVSERIPDVQLAIIGDGPLKDEVINNIKSQGLEENITRLGFVEDIYDYLHQSKVFIMTSQTEGLPTVLLEALGCGLPFIVPDVGDITDIAIADYNALVVQPRETQQFVEACVKLLTDKKLYKRLADNTQTLLKEKQKEHTLNYVHDIWEEKLRLLKNGNQKAK